ALPIRTACLRWRSGSARAASAITTALSPERTMLMPMISSSATQNCGDPSSIGRTPYFLAPQYIERVSRCQSAHFVDQDALPLEADAGQLRKHHASPEAGRATQRRLTPAAFLCAMTMGATGRISTRIVGFEARYAIHCTTVAWQSSLLQCIYRSRLSEIA